MTSTLLNKTAEKLITPKSSAEKFGANLGPFQTPLHSCTEPNWWVKYNRGAAFESIWFDRLGLERKQYLIRQVLPHYATLGRQLIHTAFSSCAEPSVWITVILFFMYGTRDWFKIEWLDRSCMKHEGIAKKRQQETRFALPFMPSIYKKRDCMSQFHKRK